MIKAISFRANKANNIVEKKTGNGMPSVLGTDKQQSANSQKSKAKNNAVPESRGKSVIDSLSGGRI